MGRMGNDERMKILLLTTNTGQGHNSAAGALSARLRALGCETITGDILKTGRRNVSAGVSGTYVALVRHAPHFFGGLYHIGEMVSSSRTHSPIYYLNTLYADSFRRRLSEIRPDLIVCTHIFSAQALTCLRERGFDRTPAVAVMTDYCWSPFWEETRLDRYYIPSPLLTQQFTSRGIPAEKIVPIGIPASASPIRDAERSAARHGLSLREDRPVFLCIGGSMGVGDMVRVCRELAGCLPGAQILAVCGSNRRLYERVASLPGVRAYAYSDEVERMMRAADVLVTKPGGLTITEAAVCRLPMVLTSPIPGGELYNARFFAGLGMAAFVPHPGEAARAACALAEDAQAAQTMRQAQARHVPQDAAERMAGDMTALVRSLTSRMPTEAAMGS